jgi:hypothetical protein
MIMRKIILLLLLPVSLAAQKDYPSSLKQFMTGQHDYFRFNGNVLVAREGHIIYQQDLGFADFNSKRPLNDVLFLNWPLFPNNSRLWAS